jgi:hypothetical protein
MGAATSHQYQPPTTPRNEQLKVRGCYHSYYCLTLATNRELRLYYIEDTEQVVATVDVPQLNTVVVVVVSVRTSIIAYHSNYKHYRTGCANKNTLYGRAEVCGPAHEGVLNVHHALWGALALLRQWPKTKAAITLRSVVGSTGEGSGAGMSPQGLAVQRVKVQEPVPPRRSPTLSGWLAQKQVKLK